MLFSSKDIRHNTNIHFIDLSMPSNTELWAIRARAAADAKRAVGR